MNCVAVDPTTGQINHNSEYMLYTRSPEHRWVTTWDFVQKRQVPVLINKQGDTIINVECLSTRVYVYYVKGISSTQTFDTWYGAYQHADQILAQRLVCSACLKAFGLNSGDEWTSWLWGVLDGRRTEG